MILSLLGMRNFENEKEKIPSYSLGGSKRMRENAPAEIGGNSGWQVTPEFRRFARQEGSKDLSSSQTIFLVNSLLG